MWWYKYSLWFSGRYFAFITITKKRNINQARLENDLNGLIRSYVLKYKDSYSIEAIGIGFPGIVDLTYEVLF